METYKNFTSKHSIPDMLDESQAAFINTFYLNKSKSLNSPALAPCTLAPFIALGQISGISGCFCLQVNCPREEQGLPDSPFLLKLPPPLPAFPLAVALLLLLSPEVAVQPEEAPG